MPEIPTPIQAENEAPEKLERERLDALMISIEDKQFLEKINNPNKKWNDLWKNDGIKKITSKNPYIRAKAASNFMFTALVPKNIIEKIFTDSNSLVRAAAARNQFIINRFPILTRNLFFDK